MNGMSSAQVTEKNSPMARPSMMPIRELTLASASGDQSPRAASWISSGSAAPVSGE